MNLSKTKIIDMANFTPESTGVDRMVFVSSKQPRHKPRVKVAVTSHVIQGSTVSFSIEDEPKPIVGDVSKLPKKVVSQIIEWIKLNKEVLLKYWNFEVDTVYLTNHLKKIS